MVSVISLILDKFPSYDKDKALSLVLCKNVYVNGELVTDPKSKFPKTASIDVLYTNKYVSRGGIKLEKALKEFNIDASGKVFLDAGCSTGGFTDCLIKNGAKLVHSIDVGYNLLDYSLRIDPKVKLYERTNIMSVSELNPVPNMAVLDLSFRSVRKVAKHILSLTTDHTAVALIKPQFEVPPEVKDFNGVISSDELLFKVMDAVYDILSEDEVFILDITVSPIKGHKGNREFLALLSDIFLTNSLSKSDYMLKLT